MVTMNIRLVKMSRNPWRKVGRRMAEALVVVYLPNPFAQLNLPWQKILWVAGSIFLIACGVGIWLIHAKGSSQDGDNY